MRLWANHMLLQTDMNASIEQAYDATDLAEMTEEGLYLNDKAFASHLPTISAVWTGEDYLVRHRKLGPAPFLSANNHCGSAKATKWPPLGRPDFPPPAEITTYCRPFTI